MNDGRSAGPPHTEYPSVSPSHPKLSLVVVNYGTPHLVANLLRSLQTHSDRALIADCAVVDNGYPGLGDSRAAIDARAHPFPVRFVQNPGHSYASGVNRGAACCEGEALAVLNSDIEWLPGHSVRPVLDHLLADASLGIAGPQLLFPDGRWQRSHGRFPSLANAARALLLGELLANALAAARLRQHRLGTTRRFVDYVDGACMVIRRACFDQVGGFDESFSFYAEDADFCWRARRAGWRSAFVPLARIMHVRGASSTAVRGVEYSQRMYVANRRFVERAAGPRKAAWYARIQVAYATELALLYRLVAHARRSATWQARAAAARDAVEAARRAMASE